MFVVLDTNKVRHEFCCRPDTYVHEGTLQVYDPDERKTVTFSLANVIKWWAE